MEYTYTTSCYGTTQTFHVQHGAAVHNGIHFNVYLPHYGDVTGDGRPEAVIPYQCSGADTAGVHVFVYSGSASHPVLLADLPQQKASGALENITKIAIQHGELHLAGTGYSPGTPHCCPDLSVQETYRWNGKQLVLVRSLVNKAK